MYWVKNILKMNLYVKKHNICFSSHHGSRNLDNTIQHVVWLFFFSKNKGVQLHYKKFEPAHEPFLDRLGLMTLDFFSVFCFFYKKICIFQNNIFIWIKINTIFLYFLCVLYLTFFK